MITYEQLAKVNGEIATVNIKGKEYAEVPHRINAFRKLFPEGTIKTEMIACENGVCVFKAEAWDGDTLISTGHAYEKEGSTFINKTSYIENCETSAVGRCLGLAGLGIEVSVASAEEVQTAIANQGTGSSADKGTMVKRIKELAEEKGVSEKEICARGEVEEIKDMVASQMEACVTWLKGLKKGE